MTEHINLAEATFAKELKSHILSDIYALYTPTHPNLPATSYAIVTSGRTSYLNNTRYSGITAYAILYTKPNQWKLLVAGNETNSVDAALTNLWKEVQANVMVVVAPMKIGDVYKGSRAV